MDTLGLPPSSAATTVAADRPLRVLVVTESFLPQVNGVTNSVRRVLEHLQAQGHDAMVVAPSGPAWYAGAPVRVVRSVAMPSYREFPIGTATRRTLHHLMWAFDPDVVHLASPAWLGHQAGEVARRRGVPVVAVYQTDLVGFAERYPIPGAVAAMRALTRRVHVPADRTLVPSTASRHQLAGLGVQRMHVWGRGVDTEQFRPERRTDALHRELGVSRVVGYVGRLAAEKELELLASVQDLPDTRLVLVGGGPEEQRLRQVLPRASFLGVRHGGDLGRLVASFDVFCHTGSTETFCQSAQEALASGVPVVAPAAGGPLDLVRPEVNGLLYAPGDAAGLHRQVVRLLDDQPTRWRMGQAARAGVADRSWTALGEQLVGHYRAVQRVARDAPGRRHRGV